MDAQVYKVMPIAAPTDEELARHYLWRFWRQLPRAGQVLIFDRSWYGRVLVERVEHLATEIEWQRASSEINEFEKQLTDHGMIVLKFWLHIDADEQLRRFKERESTPYKKYKITAEDYRNREQWRAYEIAVSDMVTNTSTEYARWHLIPATDKRYARIEVFKILCQALKQRLKPSSGKS
jgi:polyphosphate kinase 2 (PPK2 family)